MYIQTKIVIFLFTELMPNRRRTFLASYDNTELILVLYNKLSIRFQDRQFRTEAKRFFPWTYIGFTKDIFLEYRNEFYTIQNKLLFRID